MSVGCPFREQMHAYRHMRGWDFATHMRHDRVSRA
jgi:hypothetical protein